MAEKARTAVIQEAHIQGISTRSVDDRVKAQGLEGIRKSQVSRLCGEIDGRVQAFLTRPIEGEWLPGPNRARMGWLWGTDLTGSAVGGVNDDRTL